MKKYIIPAIKVAEIHKPMILAGSSDEIPAGGGTSNPPEAKSAMDFSDEPLEEEE